MMAFAGSVNIPNDKGVIYTTQNNTHSSKQVTFRGEDEYDDHPTWSPDGCRIAFTRRVLYHRRPTDIYVIDIVTGKSANLTNGKGDNECPDWY
jgi:Tol biopolymer transport system component